MFLRCNVELSQQMIPISPHLPVENISLPFSNVRCQCIRETYLTHLFHLLAAIGDLMLHMIQSYKRICVVV